MATKTRRSAKKRTSKRKGSGSTGKTITSGTTPHKQSSRLTATIETPGNADGTIYSSELTTARTAAKRKANKIGATCYTITTTAGRILERMTREEQTGNEWSGISSAEIADGNSDTL